MLPGLHGRKGAGAHVQRDAGALHAARIERGQHAFVEMQRGGGRGHRAGHAREHGLVAALVVGVVGVGDVGRQRHVAVARHQLVRRFTRRAVQAQAEQLALFVGPAADEGGVKPAATCRPPTMCSRPPSCGFLLTRRWATTSWARAVAGLVGQQHALDQHFQLATAGLLAKQAGFDHLGVVEHQQVAGASAGRAVRERCGPPARRRCRRAGARRCARRRGAGRSARGGGGNQSRRP